MKTKKTSPILNIMAGVTSTTFVSGDDPLVIPISLFLLQLMIIVCLSRAIGLVLKKFNQPTVISEGTQRICIELGELGLFSELGLF